MPHNVSQVQVLEAIGETPAATRELWRYLLGIDWVAEIHCELLRVDHPLFLLVQRPNRLHWRVLDGLWLRLVDVGAALSARSVTRRRSRHLRGRLRPDLPRQRRHLDRGGRRGDARAAAPTSGSTCRRLPAPTSEASLRRPRARRTGRGGRRGGIARADALYRLDAKPWCPEIF